MTKIYLQRRVSAATVDPRTAETADPTGIQLILFVPEGVETPALERTLASPCVAAVVAPVGALATLRPVLLAAGRALLALDDVEPAARGEADGVHLTGVARVAEARSRLGPDRLIGAGAGISRHEAMVAGEDGADYVMFGRIDDEGGLERLVDLVVWWADLFVLPCAAAGCTTPEAVEALAGARTDFIVVGPTIWQEPAVGEATILELADAIHRAGRIGPT